MLGRSYRSAPPQCSHSATRLQAEANQVKAEAYQRQPEPRPPTRTQPIQLRPTAPSDERVPEALAAEATRHSPNDAGGKAARACAPSSTKTQRTDPAAWKPLLTQRNQPPQPQTQRAKHPETGCNRRRRYAPPTRPSITETRETRVPSASLHPRHLQLALVVSRTILRANGEGTTSPRDHSGGNLALR